MSAKQPRQFGLWPSQITAKSLAAGKRLGELAWDTDGKTLVWVESRSDRSLLMAARIDGNGVMDAPRELLGDLDVRARVGYGGGDFTVSHGVVVFAEAVSGRLFRLSLAGGAPVPLTPAFGVAAAPRLSPDGRFVAYVHHDEARVDRLAVVDTAGERWPQILASGHDFYTQIRWSPDGRRFAFIAWDHPQMPWDGASLYLATVHHGDNTLPTLAGPRRVTGGTDVSVFQPEFTPDGGGLVYVSDESGFAQLYIHDLEGGTSRQVTTTPDAEYSVPNWAQEQRTYGICAEGRAAVAAVNQRGFTRLHRIDLKTGEATLLSALAGYTSVSQVTVAMDGRRFAFLGSSPAVSQRLLVHDLNAQEPRVVVRTTGEGIPASELSQPEAIQWQSGDGEAYGLYYPPASSAYSGSGLPPLLVWIHGGPTSQTRAGWSGETQFFTSRGYAVLWVNHRGSTGYGRAYMLKLRGRWGQVDVEDAVSGARHLERSGKVDGGRMVILGGSAGGYTVLQTMVDAPEAFAAGVVLYGIANQFTLVADTHKFEERYSDSLLGPLPAAAELYRQRSPVFHAAKIRRPLAIFQGDKDRVVPKEQSDVIVKALERNGTPHIYHVYAGEGHGFRRSDTLEHFYTTVEAFLREQVLYR